MLQRTEVAQKAKEILENLLEKLDVETSVEIGTETPPSPEGEESPIVLEVTGEDLGVLIGRRGQALASLQYIVRLVIASQTGSYVPVLVDVEGYRKRRDESLKALALRIAEQVKAKRVPFKLEPMPAYERRIVHLALANHPDVATSSTGEGDFRRVVVSPK